MRFPFEIHNILFLGVVRSTSILYSIPLLELIFMKQTMYYISAFLIAVLLPHVFIMTSTTMVVVLLIMRFCTIARRAFISWYIF